MQAIQANHFISSFFLYIAMAAVNIQQKKKKTFVKGMHTSHTSQYGSVKIRLFDARASDVTDTFQPF